MVKIYFGCSMSGGHGNVSREELKKIHNCIEELGYELASKYQTSEEAIKNDRKSESTYIHDRDYTWLTESEIGIFEISNPSTGTGGEISDMVHLERPVLCLFKKDLEDKVSKYPIGKQDSKYVKTPFESYAYENLEDAKNKIKEFVEKYKE